MTKGTGNVMEGWKRLLGLCVLGAAGTLARYWLDGIVQRLLGTRFPWGILIVNVLGCVLFGFVWTLLDGRTTLSRETRFLILTGFMGAFTTFSTFTFQTGEFLLHGQLRLACLNVVAQNGLGLAGLFAGMAMGRRF